MLAGNASGLVRDGATGATRKHLSLHEAVKGSRAEAEARTTAAFSGDETFLGFDLAGLDCHPNVLIYQAGSKNVTMQASSMWVAADPTTGALWNVTLPYFTAEMAPAPTGVTRYAHFQKRINANNSTGGCVTVKVTSNTSSSSSAVAQISNHMIVDVPFSICNGTCSRTTPLAAGVSYGFGISDIASHNATLRFVAFPPAHPVCLSALSELPQTNATSAFLRNAQGSAPVNGSALDLAASFSVEPGKRRLLLAYSNATCVRWWSASSRKLSPPPKEQHTGDAESVTGYLLAGDGSGTSVTLALHSEEGVGIALRRGASTEAVAAKSQCSFGKQRNASIPECGVDSGTALAVTSLDPASRYFLVAHNTGSLRALLDIVHNLYAADSCQLRGLAFRESRSFSHPALITAAQEKSAAQATDVVNALNSLIQTSVTTMTSGR